MINCCLSCLLPCLFFFFASPVWKQVHLWRQMTHTWSHFRRRAAMFVCLCDMNNTDCMPWRRVPVQHEVSVLFLCGIFQSIQHQIRWCVWIDEEAGRLFIRSPSGQATCHSLASSSPAPAPYSASSCFPLDRICVQMAFITSFACFTRASILRQKTHYTCRSTDTHQDSGSDLQVLETDPVPHLSIPIKQD